MIDIIISSYGEVNAAEKAIRSILDNNIKQDFRILVSDPFSETQWMIEEKFPNNDKVLFVEDEDKGKSNALNMLFKNFSSKDSNDIFILTDGDVFVSNNAINEIINKFNDPKVGCVSGRPTSINPKNNKFGYWSHFLVDVGAHQISRKKRYENNQFLETTGYLFAFRKGVINEIPLDVAEDTIIPYFFYKKGYKIAYAENALVNIQWPTNMKDWIKQKKRAANAHTKLTKYAPDFPKVKSFKGEFTGGIKNISLVLSYPKNFKEFFWTLELFPARMYMWLSLIKDTKIKKTQYQDGWREDLAVESTRTLD